MRRVLHCLSTVDIGGVETKVLESLIHFATKGSRYEHFLCAFRGGRLEDTMVSALREAGGHCEILGRRSRFDLAFMRSLRQAAERIQPDIIHAYNPGASLWTRVLLGGRLDWRPLVHCGGIRAASEFKWRMLERALLGRTAGFVFNSEATRSIWKRRLPIRCPCKTIYNGVSGSSQSSVDPPPPSPFVLLTVCRMTPIKSIETQFRALAILRDQGQTDVRLIVVGDGPTRAGLEREVDNLGLRDAVRFEGFQSKPEEYHARAHVYLCTSYNETFSQTLAKAMGDKMVCIAGCVGGPSEIIEDGVSGFLLPCTEPVPPSLKRIVPGSVYDAVAKAFRPPLGVDPVVLAAKIAEIRNRYDELGPMRLAAQKRISDRFSLDQYCNAIQAFYDEL